MALIYQAMMDMDVLNRGEFYTKLRKSYIIFICTFDPFDRKLSQYTFRETCAEDATLEMGERSGRFSCTANDMHKRPLCGHCAPVLREPLINSALRLHASALSSRRRQTAGVASATPAVCLLERYSAST